MNVIMILFNNLEGRSVQENLYEGHQPFVVNYSS